MRAIAAIAFLCLLSFPAHAFESPDCIRKMTPNGMACVSAGQVEASRSRTVKVAGKSFTPSPSVSFHSSAAPWLADAQRYVGHRNPTARSNLWCARFINDRLASTGRRGTGSDLAKSFLAMPRTSARPGAIAVYHRRGGGHVAVVESVSGNKVTLVSGNCGRQGVCRYTKSVGSAIAYVWPS